MPFALALALALGTVHTTSHLPARAIELWMASQRYTIEELATA